jgi:hypothetical protein
LIAEVGVSQRPGGGAHPACGLDGEPRDVELCAGDPDMAGAAAPSPVCGCVVVEVCSAILPVVVVLCVVLCVVAPASSRRRPGVVCVVLSVVRDVAVCAVVRVVLRAVVCVVACVVVCVVVVCVVVRVVLCVVGSQWLSGTAPVARSRCAARSRERPGCDDLHAGGVVWPVSGGIPAMAFSSSGVVRRPCIIWVGWSG